MMRTCAPLIVLLLLSREVVQAQNPDRSKPPEIGPPPSLRLPPIRHLTLSNGLAVLLLEKHTVPVLQVTVVVKAGSVMDPPGKNGLASLTAAMLTDGAGSRDALQLADAIDYLGADLSAAAGQHTTGISLFTQLAKLDSALTLLADVTLRPSFSPAELERNRKERLTTLLQWRDQPGSVASIAFNRAVYGADHPYGKASIGDESGIRSFRTDDMKKFHESYFRPNNSVLIVVGDITEQAVLPKLEAAFGRWQKEPIPIPVLPEIKQVKGREIIVVDKPGAAQSEIRIGCVGLPRRSDDYYAVTVLNTILGGSFTSRLNNNLRETRGYTYGARSIFVFRPLPGPFIASAAVQTEVTDSALIEFVKELNGIRGSIPSPELERGKNYVALGYPRGFQSVSQIGGQMEELAIYNLPDDYCNAFVQNILLVSAEDVQRVAQKYLDPDRLKIVIVGDREKIEQRVKRLNLGPVEIRTLDEVMGKAPAL